MAFLERARSVVPHLRYEGPQACIGPRVTQEIIAGIDRRQTPRQIAERLTAIEGVGAKVEEIEDLLIKHQVLSDIVSVARLNEIVSAAAHKTASIQNVLNLLRGVQTAFDVDRVIAREGGINTLGFSRVVVCEVVSDDKMVPIKQWTKKDGKIEEGPAPTGESLSGDHLISIPGNGNVYLFDLRDTDRPIYKEDMELLESLIKAGVETKHRIKSERRVRNENISHRTRELVSRQANDIPDLMKVLLISVGFNFHVNIAAIFMRVPRTNEYKGIFGLGSLTEEEHHQALDNLAGVRTEEDVLAVVKSQRKVDSVFNQLISKLKWEGELKEAVVVRDGRFYDSAGKEFETPPAVAEYLLGIAELPPKAKDFVVLPVKTSKTTYGFLFLANPWTGRDIDLEGISALSRDFIDLLRVMRRQSDPPASPGGLLPVNRDHLIGILRRAFKGVSDNAEAAKELLAIIRPEDREVVNEEDLKELVETWREWLGMPEGLIRLEIVAGLEPLMDKEWIGAVLGAGVIEALQAMKVGFNSDRTGLCFSPQDWVSIKLEGNTIIFEVLEEKTGEGMGIEMLKALDTELRKQGVGGIRVWAEGNTLRVRLQDFQKK
ncbi:hypothetical protein HZC35_05280 [Candidatus Saganbacteria bacterium]|nr:hypothetical protein [Candidatus Saganbacteria bacterium]